MIFDSKVIGEYLQILTLISDRETNMIRPKSFVEELAKVNMRLTVHKYQLLKKTKVRNASILCLIPAIARLAFH